MASDTTSVRPTGFSSATPGLVSARPTPRAGAREHFDEIKARQASQAERMQIIFNALGQRTGQTLNVIA